MFHVTIDWEVSIRERHLHVKMVSLKLMVSSWPHEPKKRKCRKVLRSDDTFLVVCLIVSVLRLNPRSVLWICQKCHAEITFPYNLWTQCKQICLWITFPSLDDLQQRELAALVVVFFRPSVLIWKVLFGPNTELQELRTREYLKQYECCAPDTRSHVMRHVYLRLTPTFCH